MYTTHVYAAEMDFPFNVNGVFSDVIDIWTNESLRPTTVIRGRPYVQVCVVVHCGVVYNSLLDVYVRWGINVIRIVTCINTCVAVSMKTEEPSSMLLARRQLR